MKTSVFLTLCFLASLLLAHTWYTMAYAQGAATVDIDAGAAPALEAPTPPASGVTSPAAVSDFNPLGWDWPNIFMLVLTVLGALVGILRVLAPMTKSQKDDWLLGKLEWLTDLLAKILVPKQYRLASLSGGKGGSEPPPRVPA